MEVAFSKRGHLSNRVPQNRTACADTSREVQSKKKTQANMIAQQAARAQAHNSSPWPSHRPFNGGGGVLIFFRMMKREVWTSAVAARTYIRGRSRLPRHFRMRLTAKGRGQTYVYHSLHPALRGLRAVDLVFCRGGVHRTLLEPNSLRLRSSCRDPLLAVADKSWSLVSLSSLRLGPIPDRRDASRLSTSLHDTVLRGQTFILREVAAVRVSQTPKTCSGSSRTARARCK